MKLSDYYLIKRQEYVTFKLIPTKSSRNNTTIGIAHLINSMYRSTNKLIYKENKKLIIETRLKASYYIHISKENISFYFIIPKIFQNQFKSKFSDTWKNVDIKIVDAIPVDINSCSKYQLYYKFDDALSLETDRRNNDLLSANLSTLEILQENEFIGVLYNFIPVSEKESNYFKKKSSETIQRYKNGENLKKSKNLLDYSKIALKFLIDLINALLNCLLNGEQNSQLILYPLGKETSSSTQRKLQKEILKNQTLILAHSEEKSRENQLCQSIYNSFSKINGDNELIYTKIKKDININRYIINNVKINSTSTEECSNFISLPGAELIDQYKNITHKETKENPVPKELTKGIISLGINKYKETYQEAFLSDDINLQSLPLAILGASRSGKSTFSINLSKNIIDNNEGLIALDFIKDCELANNIKAITPKDRLIDIDLSNPKMIQSLCYNEFKITSDMSAYEISSISRKQTNNLLKIVNIINGDDKELSPKMRKYLGAAARIAFCFPNSCMKDVLNILQFHEIRYKYINKLSEELKDRLKDSILSLNELDEVNKKGEVTGTKEIKIEGILDRIDLMRENIIIDEMISKTPENNIDFVKAMEERKVILIRMRDKDFDDDISIDILTSFFLQKIWAALKIRGTMHNLPDRVTVLIDEIFQTPCAQKILAKNFVQSAKFGLKYVLTLHYLQQLSQDAQRAMRNANASYMLISGVDENAFSSFRSDFEKEGYEVEDLLNLERWHSLNLVATSKGKKAFITHLPAELKIKN
ncbi:MAG: hypothetical protein ACLUTP_10640 [Terrisporobacter sp.]|uniref:hypothetical protein n=1 Tax=Terrisporobacter sp. TaxID=1965305 RepID=UPI00399AA586